MSDDFEARRQRAASVGQGLRIAADLAMATGGDLNETYSAFEAIAQGTVELVVQLQAKFDLQAAFPGATAEPAPPVFVRQTPTGPVAPAVQYTPVPPPPAAPAAPQTPIPGVSDGDPAVAALWQKYFADPTAWNDKRPNKRGPNSPDFQHRSEKQPGTDYPLALWIVDKKGTNPSWVLPTLQQRGLA